MTDDAGRHEPHSQMDIDPLADLAEEFVDRYQRGERPNIEDYAEAHPQLADEIRDMFPALVIMERLSPETDDEPVAESPQRIPESIGDYRIVREVGRGGMGIVYEAEQQSLRRRVALKVLTRSISHQATAQERFQREAQSAAQLHHQNIVPVFDVGQQDGTWYYAMQFIRGLGLDEVLVELKRIRDQGDDYAAAPGNFATQAAQTIIDGGWQATQPVPREEQSQPAAGGDSRDEKDRPGNVDSSLTLVTGDSAISDSQLAHHRYYRSVAVMGVQVARALAYAHERGIVHRDIKPSNLLLDAQANVWVTDFGLAKAEDSNLTQTGDIVGTIGYMAPERFQGWSDPRSDIYGLGITLCELLTLQPVFLASDRVALIHMVTHQEPARPRSIDRQIPPDLETIVLKAMAKEPAHRYLTASDFADDLECFIQDKPIRARRNGQLERTWRWCRRNPSVAVLAGSLLITLLGGIIGVALLWLNATGQRDMARQSEQRAIDEQAKAELLFDRATDIVEKYYLKVEAHKLEDRPGLQPLRKELLAEAMKYFEWLADQHGNNSKLQGKIAIAHWRIGDIEGEIGTFEKSEAAYRRSIEILRSLVSAGSDLPANQGLQHRQRLASVLNNLGLLYMAAGKDAEASESIEAAVRIRRDLVRRNASRSEVYNLAKHYSNLATLARRADRPEEAEKLIEKEIDLLKQLVAESPKHSPYLLSNVKALRSLGLTRMRLGDAKGGLEVVEKALKGGQHLTEMRPDDTEFQQSLANCYHSYAIVSHALKDRKGVERGFQRAIEIGERLIKESPDVHRYHKHLGFYYYGFGSFLKNSKRLEEAKSCFQNSVARRSRVLERNQADEENQHNLGWALFNLAVVRRDLKDFAGAEKSFAKAASQWQQLIKKDYAASAFCFANADLERAVTVLQAGTFDNKDYDRTLQRLAALLDNVELRQRAMVSLIRGHDQRASRLIKLNRYDEARPDIEFVVANSVAKQASGYRLAYSKSLMAKRDYRNAMIEVAKLERMPGFTQLTIVDAAIVCAMSAGYAAKDKKLSESKRVEVSEEYSSKAIEFFEQLRESKFKMPAKALRFLRTTKLLRQLRKRPEFTRLLDDFAR